MTFIYSKFLYCCDHDDIFEAQCGLAECHVLFSLLVVCIIDERKFKWVGGWVWVCINKCINIPSLRNLLCTNRNWVYQKTRQIAHVKSKNIVG